jgi:isopenicillin N synthase-like dioxygenase
MAGFQDDVMAYYAHLMGIGRQLFGAFALALGLDEDHFDAYLLNPPSQLRLIRYPRDDSAQDRSGIGANTDHECFTLLFATAPGLQIVSRQGVWIDVPLVEGTMIMNIGDMMEILSNGGYLATRHRVKKVRQERYSFPMFHACDYDYVVVPLTKEEAPRYAPLKGGEHLFDQTAQAFAYLKRRIAAGDLALPDAMPLHSFGQQDV